MKNNLIKTDIKNENTGLSLIGKAYKAQSGFLYAAGYREFGNLKIIEEVASGTAVTLLLGVKIFNKEGILLIDKKIKKGCYYEREKTRKIVLEELLKMLIEQNDPNFNYDNAKNIIDEKLKQAYFSKSYEAIKNWGIELGILNN